MTKIWPLVIASWLTLLMGCSEKAQHGEASGTVQTLAGEVLYRERILLPPGAELQVTLEDVSRMDVPSTIIASSSQLLTGAPPYPYILKFAAQDIDTRMQYSLRATIRAEGGLLFTSTERLDPFKNPADAITIMLSMVSSISTQQQAARPAETDTGLAVVSVNPLAELTNTYWKLANLNDTDVVVAQGQEREAFLQLRDDKKSVKGFAGCNRFSGRFTVDGNDLSFGPIATTRKACPAGMDTETEFLRVLEGTAYFSIQEETLTLLDENKKPAARLVAVYFD